MTIHLENGKKVEINASGNNSQSRYISDVRINGKASSKNYFTHTDLMKGAKIDFIMSDAPNKNRGVKQADYPYSFTNEK